MNPLCQAIEVKYLPCTSTKPSRWKATCAAKSITRSHDYGVNADDNAAAIAAELATSLNWLDKAELRGELRGGTLKSGIRVFIIVERSA